LMLLDPPPGWACCVTIRMFARIETAIYLWSVLALEHAFQLTRIAVEWDLGS
jgi:hypothetical protein